MILYTMDCDHHCCVKVSICPWKKKATDILVTDGWHCKIFDPSVNAEGVFHFEEDRLHKQIVRKQNFVNTYSCTIPTIVITLDSMAVKR